MSLSHRCLRKIEATLWTKLRGGGPGEGVKGIDNKTSVPWERTVVVDGGGIGGIEATCA